MKKQITHISLHQTAKILTILTFIVTAVFAIPFGIFLLFQEDRLAAVPVFFVPFLYALFSYIFWVVYGWLYNLVAKHFGGVEFTVKEIE